jgi:pimeloyl-ACP methyl ester carboxylesterase
MPDLRGHGWSDAPRCGYDKEQLATDMLQLLDRLEQPRHQH